MIIDVKRAIAFYELRDEIIDELKMWIANIHHDKRYQDVEILIDKIEAIEKEGDK